MINDYKKFLESNENNEAEMSVMPYEVGSIIERKPRYNGNAEYYELVSYVGKESRYSSVYNTKYYIHEYEAYQLKANLKEIKGTKLKIKLIDAINKSNHKLNNTSVYVIKKPDGKLVSSDYLEADNKRTDLQPLEIKGVKPPYLMLKDEYKKTITPLFKKYMKFVDANDKYIKRDYDKLAAYTADEYGVDSFMYKYHFDVKEVVPSSVIEERNKYFKEIEDIFGYSVNKMNTTYVNSNRDCIKKAIDDGTYENLLKDGVINIKNIEMLLTDAKYKIPTKFYEIDKNLNVLGITKEVEGDLMAGRLKFISDLKNKFKVVYDSKRENYYQYYYKIISKYAKFIENYDFTTMQKLKWDFNIFATGKDPKIEIKETRSGSIKTILYSYYVLDLFSYNIVGADSKLPNDWDDKIKIKSIKYADDIFENFADKLLYKFSGLNKKQFPVVEEGTLGHYSSKGFDCELLIKYPNGFVFEIKANAIWAGGYNIQVEHVRGLFKYFYKDKNVSSSDIIKLYKEFNI